MEVHMGVNSTPRVSGKQKGIETSQRLLKTSNSKVFERIS